MSNEYDKDSYSQIVVKFANSVSTASTRLIQSKRNLHIGSCSIN